MSNAPTNTPRRETGPGCSEGRLSAEFPEVDVKVSAEFAHDAGMISRIESITVGGEACNKTEVLQALVALRQGWTPGGGSDDEAVLNTFKAYVAAWGKILPHSGRLTLPKAPAGLKNVRPGAPDYHSPRVAIYALDDGDKIAVHAFFRTWDGGNHGTQFAYAVEAYRVSDGSAYDLERKRGLPAAIEAPSGPQPVDPQVPRPQHLSY